MLHRMLCVLVCCLVLVSLASADGLIVNGGFEEPADGPPTTLTPWGRFQSTPETAYRVTDQVADGKWALCVKEDIAGGAQVVQQKLADYQPNQLYEVILHVLSAEPEDGIRADVIDRHPKLPYASTLVAQVCSGTEWKQYALRFTAPKEAGHPLYLRFYSTGPRTDTTMYLDDVSVVPVSEIAMKFAETYTQVENDTFNAIVQVEYDLSTELDVARWLVADLAEHKAADVGKLRTLGERGRQLADKLRAGLDQLKRLREGRLQKGVTLSALPDAEIAQKLQDLTALPDDLNQAIQKARAELEPQITTYSTDAAAQAGDWQPPAQRTAQYSPATLKDRFHRIISYHGFMPATPYLLRAMWELRPTAIQGYLNRDTKKDNRAEFLRLNKPRTIPYIEQIGCPNWLWDLTETKAGIDAALAEIGDDPAFSGFEIDEPGITDKSVCTPEGYAQFRFWLASRYDKEVGGFPIAEALAWELPEKIATDFDRVMWTELQQFKTYWFAHQLKEIQDYIYSKKPDAVLLVVICQLLPSAPQWSSYVTTSAALDWIGMDPYNSANVGEALLMDLLRSNSKGPNLLVVGTCYDSTAGRFAKDMAISFAHCGGVWNWCWVYMANYRAPVGITRGAWPLPYRGRWKEGMYEAAQDIMGKMATIEPYLVHTDTGANVGLVYSERTGIYCSLPGTPGYYLSNFGIYQALQQLQIPCEALFAESMTPEKLSNFRTLLLVDAEVLTDSETALLKDWCNQGGSLVVMGATGTRDQWGRARQDFGGLTELLGVSRAEAKSDAKTWTLDGGAEVKLGTDWHYETVEPTDTSARVIGRFDNGAIAAVSRPYGRGHAYLLTAHGLGVSFDGNKGMKGMYKYYWPGFNENLSKLVLAALDKAGGRLPVTAQNTPVNVEVGLRKQGDRLVVHLLNYDDEGPVSGMALLADGRAGQKAFNPEDGTQTGATDRGRDLEIPVRDFEHYCCIVIEPK